MIGIRKPMPRVFGYEYRCALLKRVTHVVQYENSAALQNQECFVHPEVTVDRNACADHHLLGAEGEIVGACSGADIDDDLTAVTKMNELFAFVCAKHISLPRCGLSRDDVLSKEDIILTAIRTSLDGVRSIVSEILAQSYLAFGNNR